MVETKKDTKGADKILKDNEEKIASEKKARKDEADAKAKKDNPGRGDTVVLDKDGVYARTYSERHNDPKEMKDGKTYQEKAVGYAEKIGGKVQKA